MDENYLDELLKGIESQDNDIEEPVEVDGNMTDGEMLHDSELEESILADASAINGVAWSDAEIPVDEISELDELDDLADLDMGDLDFEDIDFDDLDVTNMDVNPVQFEKELENLENLTIDENYLDESEEQAFEEEFRRMKDKKKAEAEEPIYEDQDYVDTMEADSTDAPGSMNQVAEGPEIQTEADVDALMAEVFGTSSEETGQEEDTGENPQPELDMSEKNTDSDAASDDMEDLFAMLGIDEHSDSMASSGMPNEEEEIPDFEIPPELQDIPDISEKKKKKKSFMEILFGEDEEDDVLTPEQEEELQKAKEEKKQAKLAKKEAKKEEKAAKAEQKKAEKETKSEQVKAKKAARKAEDERILAEDGPDKKLNKPLVVIIMLFFLAIGGTVIVGTNIFDYTLVITKAKDYFERQKYGLAYREIVGVEVKEKDEELESQIYTVMYVERQYEAYQNYMTMNQPDRALNALVSGLDKYDEYYEDAVALGISSDLDYAKAEIVSALSSTYSLSEADAKELSGLEGDAYTKAIQDLSSNITLQEE